MIPGQRKIRGIRDKIKPGQLIGKPLGALNARGHSGPLNPAQAKAFLRYVADEISNTSTLAGNSVADALTGVATLLLSAIPDGDILANISGSSAVPIGNTLSAILDHVLGNAQGDIIYRDSGVWKVLAPGTSGQFLQTQGVAANPQWAATSGLPSIADGDLLANTSGGAALPVATTLSALIDYVFGSTQGSILYRDTSAWKVLGPGTAGFVLLTNGAGANPSWSGATGISGAQAQIYPSFTTPNNASFSWANQGGASVTVNANGSISLIAPKNSSNPNLRVRFLSVTGTYIITAAVIPTVVNQNFQTVGLCFRQSSGGSILTLGIEADGNNTSLVIGRYNSPTSFSANAAQQTIYRTSGVVWLRIQDDGTNRIYSYSMDGWLFTQIFSEARTTFLTADGVGFFADEETNTYQAMMNLLSWAKT